MRPTPPVAAAIAEAAHLVQPCTRPDAAGGGPSAGDPSGAFGIGPEAARAFEATLRKQVALAAVRERKRCEKVAARQASRQTHIAPVFKHAGNRYGWAFRAGMM